MRYVCGACPEYLTDHVLTVVCVRACVRSKSHMQEQLREDATDTMEDRGEDYEEEHVHSVYEEIAPHFSSTRYKVCPPPTSRNSWQN